MCTHRFVFPEDKPENYNTDGKTITGKCKCGAIQKAYGVNRFEFDDDLLDNEPDAWYNSV